MINSNDKTIVLDTHEWSSDYRTIIETLNMPHYMPNNDAVKWHEWNDVNLRPSYVDALKCYALTVIF